MLTGAILAKGCEVPSMLIKQYNNIKSKDKLSWIIVRSVFQLKSRVEIMKYMSYKILLLLALFLTLGLAYTDITMLNCPAQFDITQFNTTTDTTVSTMGSFIYAGYSSQSSQQKTNQIVTKGDLTALDSYQKQLMVPYIIFGVIYFVFYICTVASCLFDRSCPPSECIRRNLDQDTYTKKQIKICTGTLVVVALSILVISIFSYSLVPEMKENLQMTSCGIYLTLDTTINGDGAWGGFTSLRDKVGNITNLLSAAVTQIQIYFPGDEWLVDTMQSMQTANLDIYNTYKSQQMITPNPTNTATAVNAEQGTPNIDSRFIKTGMGPNGTANTMVTDIDAGLQITAKLSNQAYAITKSAEMIQSSVTTILSNSQAAQNNLLMYNHQLGVAVKEYDTFNKQYFIDNFGTAITVFQAVFGLALAGSLVVLLGVASTHLFDLLSCRNMVHLGWTIYAFAYFGVIIVTYFTLSVGSISYNFCTYFKDMLTVQVSYDKLGAAYSQNMFTRLDVCIFGNGNAMQKFSIANEMNTVTSLFTNIQSYTILKNANSSSYVDLTISNTKISGWVSAINKYKLGVYVDADAIITNDDNPNYAISQLNKYTYQGGGVTTGSNDVWVWDKTNCTDSTQITYNSNASNGTVLSTGYVTCISFNQYLSTNQTNIWSFNDFAYRYVQIRNTYGPAYDRIILYGASLIAFRDSRINLFQAMQDDLSALLVTNTNFNTQLTNFDGRVTQFSSSVSTLSNLITNTLDGLVLTTNCNSLADKLRFVHNIYCVNFMAQITKMALCSILMMVLMLIGVYAGSRFGMMYAEIEKVKRVLMPEEINSEKDIKGAHTQDELNHSTHSNQSDD